MADRTATLPVTGLETLPGLPPRFVRVTAEYPLQTPSVWLKVQFTVPISQAPPLGETLKVTIGD